MQKSLRIYTLILKKLLIENAQIELIEDVKEREDDHHHDCNVIPHHEFHDIIVRSHDRKNISEDSREHNGRYADL